MTGNEGGGKRMARIEREIREIVASQLISSFRSTIPGLVTVTRVWVSKDLRLSRVYISFLEIGEEKNPKATQTVVKELNVQAYEFQRAIGHDLKMRYTPKLEFFIDDTLDESLRVQGLIQKIEEERLEKEKSQKTAVRQEDADSETQDS